MTNPSNKRFVVTGENLETLDAHIAYAKAQGDRASGAADQIGQFVGEAEVVLADIGELQDALLITANLTPVANDAAAIAAGNGGYRNISTQEQLIVSGGVITARSPAGPTLGTTAYAHNGLNAMLASAINMPYQTAGGSKGLGHLFELLAAGDATPADGLYVVQRADGRKLRRNYSGVADLSWATGIDQAGNADSRAALQAIVSASAGKSLLIPLGVRLAISAYVELPDNLTLTMDGTVIYTGTDPASVDALFLAGNGNTISGAGEYTRTDAARRGLRAFKVLSKQNVTIMNPRCSNGVAVLHTTAAGGAGDYAGVNDGNICRNITLINPRADGNNRDAPDGAGMEAGIPAVLMEYVADWSVEGGRLAGFQHGVQ